MQKLLLVIIFSFLMGNVSSAAVICNNTEGYEVSYVKIHGEDAGSVLHDRPSVLSVTDNMKDGETIQLVRGKGDSFPGVKIGNIR